MLTVVVYNLGRFFSQAINACNNHSESTKSNPVNRNGGRLLPSYDRQMDKSDYFTRYESVDNILVEHKPYAEAISVSEDVVKTSSDTYQKTKNKVQMTLPFSSFFKDRSLCILFY